MAARVAGAIRGTLRKLRLTAAEPLTARGRARLRASGCSDGPTEAVNLLVLKVKRSGTASATSPTTAHGGCCTAAPVADAPDGEAARPLPTLGGIAPVNETLRRLIGSSVVVGPASRSRRHERPSGMVVSRRSGKRPPRWAARQQARVGSGSASPPPVVPTVLASPRSLSQFGLARLVSAGRRADAARLGGLREGPLGPTIAGPLAAAAEGWRAATQAEIPWCVSGLELLGGVWPPPAVPLVHCPIRWQTYRTTSLRGRPHAWWRRATFPPLPGRHLSVSHRCSASSPSLGPGGRSSWPVRRGLQRHTAVRRDDLSGGVAGFLRA